MALVDTRINYFTPSADESQPYKWIDGVDAPRLNWTPIEFDVRVENVRGRESDFTLDKAGFEFHNVPTQVNFEDENSIRTVYYQHSIQVIKNLTGASRVVIFDHSESSRLI